MTHNRIQRWRLLVRAVLLAAALGLPFLRIGGQSAFRFDIPSLKLYFFGTALWMDQFFLVLVAVLILSFLLVFLTVLFGRLWCGWTCPQTIIVDLTGFLDRARSGGVFSRAGAATVLLVISIVLAADSIWFFVDPREFFSQLSSGTLGPVVSLSWTVLSILTFLNVLLVRRTFCATVCPYAKLQGALFDERTLIIAPDAARMEQCLHCDACVRVCPVGIDVREGVRSECVSCAACIDACAARMQRRGLASLIGYHFGAEPFRGRLFRRAVVLPAAVTVLFIALFMIIIMTALPLDMDVAADPSFPPIRYGESAVVNTYLVSLTNRSDAPQVLALTASGREGPVGTQPGSVLLGRGEHRQLRLSLRADGTSRLRTAPEPVIITASVPAIPGLRIERRTAMLPPW